MTARMVPAASSLSQLNYPKRANPRYCLQHECVPINFRVVWFDFNNCDSLWFLAFLSMKTFLAQRFFFLSSPGTLVRAFDR
jgi:hypothetical protein